jgi:hypothetical protein
VSVAKVAERNARASSGACDATRASSDIVSDDPFPVAGRTVLEGHRELTSVHSESGWARGARRCAPARSAQPRALTVNTTFAREGRAEWTVTLRPEACAACAR